MLADLKMLNQSRDDDWSDDGKPAKFGDDPVAEENYGWVLVAPSPVTWRWKWPLDTGQTRPSNFLADVAITIRNVWTWIYIITIKGPNDKIQMLSFITVP